MTDRPPNMNPATVSSVSIPMSGRRMTHQPRPTPASVAGLAPAAPPQRLGLELRAGVDAAGRLAGQAGRQREQDDRDDPERDRVEREREGQVGCRDDQAGDRRADDERQLAEGREQAVRGAQLPLVADEARQVGADRRAEEAREAGREDGERDDREDRAVGRDDHGHRHHDQAPGDVGDEQDAAPVEAVDDDPGRHREEHVRQDPRRADDAQQRPGRRSPRTPRRAARRGTASRRCRRRTRPRTGGQARCWRGPRGRR